MRELGPDDGHLIHYRRDDLAGPKRSDYEIAKTEDPESMRAMLSQIMGAWVEVEKTRQVWLWENVRIHLDDVKGLGQFVELEAVMEEIGRHTSELQSHSDLVCRLLLEKKNREKANTSNEGSRHVKEPIT